MKWFHYSQNNTGGTFIGPAGHVCIEAENAADADVRAVAAGLYFNGCDDGTDCSCCGDRWSAKSEWDRKGTDEPMVYDERAAEYEDYFADRVPVSVLVIHADGKREEFSKKKASLV